MSTPLDRIIEAAKQQMMQQSGISAAGMLELMQARIVTNPKDRKALAGYLYYVWGRLQSCPANPGLAKYSHFHD